MLCYCGRDLREATPKTTGLCPDCGQSIWMQAARRLRPNSKEIARGLNLSAAERCEHRQTACFSRCGVELKRGTWEAVPFQDRQNWFARVMSRERKAVA